jgi:hypothetical protein
MKTGIILAENFRVCCRKKPAGFCGQPLYQAIGKEHTATGTVPTFLSAFPQPFSLMLVQQPFL